MLLNEVHKLCTFAAAPELLFGGCNVYKAAFSGATVQYFTTFDSFAFARCLYLSLVQFCKVTAFCLAKIFNSSAMFGMKNKLYCSSVLVEMNAHSLFSFGLLYHDNHCCMIYYFVRSVDGVRRPIKIRHITSLVG
ncbi:hypothetical protein KFK09_005917 [Dendrobium nobile]|uniref:Uncharacterized protein n=1 Tax=Dendrobium nobile TaxID=94219 RepID=A0A8T3BZL6_DENNO|nr:hypothetical protein KFK09_005917 [Dendrobium nobile]